MGYDLSSLYALPSRPRIIKQNMGLLLPISPWLDMGVKRLVCLRDSQLMVNQVSGSFQVKDSLLTAYYQKVLTMLTHFESVKIEHILRNNNSRADVLSKLALGKGKGRYDTIIKITLS